MLRSSALLSAAERGMDNYLSHTYQEHSFNRSSHMFKETESDPVNVYKKGKDQTIYTGAFFKALTTEHRDHLVRVDNGLI